MSAVPICARSGFEVMAAVKSAELRVRLKVLTWQELAALAARRAPAFLDVKYGIVAPGQTPRHPRRVAPVSTGCELIGGPRDSEASRAKAHVICGFGPIVPCYKAPAEFFRGI